MRLITLVFMLLFTSQACSGWFSDEPIPKDELYKYRSMAHTLREKVDYQQIDRKIESAKVAYNTAKKEYSKFDKDGYYEALEFLKKNINKRPLNSDSFRIKSISIGNDSFILDISNKSDFTVVAFSFEVYVDHGSYVEFRRRLSDNIRVEPSESTLIQIPFNSREFKHRSKSQLKKALSRWDQARINISTSGNYNNKNLVEFSEAWLLDNPILGEKFKEESKPGRLPLTAYEPHTFLNEKVINYIEKELSIAEGRLKRNAEHMEEVVNSVKEELNEHLKRVDKSHLWINEFIDKYKDNDNFFGKYTELSHDKFKKAINSIHKTKREELINYLKDI